MEKCPTLKIMNTAGKKWTFAILQELHLYENLGFNSLARKLGRITPKVLSKMLTEMEINGLVKKAVFNGKFKSSKYSLTEKGHELKSIIESVREWNMKYREDDLDCSGIKECVKCPYF